MAKQLNNGATVQGVNGNDSKFAYTTPDVITTSKGEKVKIVGLNQGRFESLQKGGKEPEVPYREYQTDFGEAQREALTKDDLQNDEEKALWAEYQDKLAALNEKRSLNVLRYVYDDGIIVDESKMEQWRQEEEEIYENELPKNRIDLKVAYINAKIIGNQDDMAEIMAAVMERTGVPPHMLDEVRDSFRSTVRRNPAEGSTESEGSGEQVDVSEPVRIS